MPKRFDATLKDLIAAYPGDWLRHLGVSVVEPVEILSPDLSAVTAMADTLIRVGDRVIHIDIESGPDDDLASRLLLYNILAHRHSGLPVHSVAVLLRSNAKASNLTGEFTYAPQPLGEVRFRFEVVRVWERPMDDLFAGGPGLMPLAVLGKPPKGQSRAKAIPDTLVSIAEEASRSVPQERTKRIVAAALLLAAMHVETDAIRNTIRRFPAVIESHAFAVLEELVGVKQCQEIIQLQGREKFGVPTPAQEKKLDAIVDLERLKRLGVRLLKVNSWDDLLKGK
jgi:hypothetical protein